MFARGRLLSTRFSAPLGRPSSLLLAGGGGGLVRRTPTLLFWPIVGRIVAGVAIVVLQSMWDAHRSEAARLARVYGSDQQQAKLSMTREEALAVLGVQSASPKASGLLQGAEAAEATARFQRFFRDASAAENVYLQGKFSGAYRILVDPQWDAAHADLTWMAPPDANGGSASSDAKQRIDDGSQRRG